MDTAARRERHEVVPVAPDDVLRAGQVPRRHLEAGHLRQLPEQQGALQCGGQPVVLLGPAQRGRGDVRRQGAGRGDLVRAPRPRRLAHRLAPRVERTPRAQPRPGVGLRRLGGVRVATPGDLAQRLRPEPGEEVPPAAGDLDGEHATGAGGEIGRVGHHPADRVGHRRPGGEQGPHQRLHPLGRRRGPEQAQLAVDPDGGPGGRQQVEGGHLAVGERRGDRSRGAADDGGQLGLPPRDLDDPRLLAGRHLRVQQQRRGAAEELRGGAVGVGGPVRPGVVVAGDETPQPAAVDERHRHRRDDTHVGQVLQVHRRDAPQHRARQIERAAVDERRLQGHPRVGGVGDEPQPVGGVEGAGLGGDVARRVPETEEGLEVLPPVLGDDLAVPVGVEPVDHHPVEAGERAHLAGQHLGQLVERGRTRQPLQDRGQPPVPGRARLPGALDPLPLGDQQPVGAGEHQVDVATGQPHPQRVHLGEIAGEARTQPGDVVVREQLGQGTAGHRPAEEVRGVGGGDDDGEVVLGDGQQGAVRLDRAGDRDGLVGAAEQRLLGHGGAVDAHPREATGGPRGRRRRAAPRPTRRSARRCRAPAGRWAAGSPRSRAGR